MKIDRDRFLVLVTAMTSSVIFAPACDGSPSSVEASHREATSVVETTATNIVIEDAGTTDAGKSSPDPYKGTPISAQSCNPALNRVGAPKACALKAPGPSCESFSDTKKECPTLNGLLKPRVAAAAIDCMNRRSGTKDICEFNVSSICAYEALESACLEPSAKAVCNKVMSRCGGPKGRYNKMTQAACEAGVSGISDAKRAKFISCISEFCRFEVCLTTL